MRPSLLLALAAVVAGCDGDYETLVKPRTVRVVEGPVVPVGRNLTTCSHEPAAGGSPERWCAFARPLAEGGAELWVLNVQRALAERVACDGSSPHCLRLTTELWTGQPVFAPAHPTIHAFHGNTLVFYARSSTGNTDADYEGAIQAWRPGATSAQVITGERGRVCIGHDRSGGMICIDRERIVGGEIEFDMLAGLFGAGQPLPRIETIRPVDEDGDLLWQVAFSPTGSHFAFSDRVPGARKLERLRVLEIGELGRTPARELLRDVASWQFSGDGRQLFFLRGFNYGEGGMSSGTLTVADFPSGANLRELQPRVGRFDLYGEAGAATRAVGLYQDMSLFSGRFSIMSDLARPTELTMIGANVEDALVSPDLRHSLLFGFDDEGIAATFIARNDGSGRCQIGVHPGASVYAPTFLTSPPVFLWAEDSAENPLLTEGWLGDPQSCQQGQRFSTRLSLYQTTRSGMVWGEQEESPRTLTLRYTRFAGATLDVDSSELLGQTVDNRVSFIDGRYVLFTISQGAAEEAGLYLHGPL